MLSIGMIGCGFIGTIHSFALKALVDAGLVDARVTHICEEAEDKAAFAAAAHGAEATADVADLITAVDVVWICTPTAGHLPLAEAAADAGRAVLCEKPLGRDLAEAERVVAALERVPHRVGLVLRCAPVFLALRDELTSGRHGRPMAAVFRDDQWFPLGGMYGSTWRADAEQAGAGTLIEHSIHDVDLLRWCLGEATVVTGQTANFAGHAGVEDTANVGLTFANGAVASLTSVWHRVASRPSTRRLEVFCEDAVLWLDDDSTGPLHVETSAGATVRECPLPGWAEKLAVPDEFRTALALYAAPSREFLEDVAAGRPPRGPNGADALAAHRIVDAAYRSADLGGSPVRL